ncbi:peptide ABC transporter substrate-binding protein [Helicovermis profundi]|uniref:Peptide ABC transporter substrate-binding protein n=1 Tax=Helicovermis profundi TaxID=3065157 RepID=A0AAU9EQA2_9FIRM|nr:peptide ABC transporter substrate-binding protein [Clostridia bacterium S502]
MKRMLSVIMLVVLLFVFAGCSNDKTSAVSNEKEVNNAKTTESSDQGDTNKESGKVDKITYAKDQTYTSIYSGEISTLNYLTSSSTNEIGLASNFVDTLVDYDQYGVMIPSLATEWISSENGNVWTFKIRKGVNWYTSEGEVYGELTAQDFVDSLKYTFNKDNGSKTANIAYKVLKNGKKYYDGEITDFSKVGVKAIDKYTLQYTLETPVPYFESMLTYASFFPVNGKFLAEVGDKFGTSNDNILYNGAYILQKFEPQNSRILVENENYWDKDKVFIKKLKYKYNKEAKTIGQELFLRGDISEVYVPSTSIDAWMQDKDKKEMVRPSNPSFYTYFYAINFDPNFDKAYDPENWKKAVNNVNFRKSLFHGLDRVAALTTGEPYNPKNKIANTVTPPNFVNEDGIDFTQMGSLKKFTDTDSYNSDLAIQFKEKAMKDLEGKVDFPVKVVIPYSTGSSENAQRAQVVQQQLTRTLGDDYVEVFIVPYPPSGFLSNTRRVGKYGMELVNWGPDFADPETYTYMFIPGSNYNFPEKTTEVDENGNNKFDVYMKMVTAATNEKVDLAKRYNLFAEAEAYLIDQAWVIPYRLGGNGGYVASKLDPFEAPYSPFGVSSLRYKGQHILDKPMSTELYLSEKAKWNEKRKEILNSLK